MFELTCSITYIFKAKKIECKNSHYFLRITLGKIKYGLWKKKFSLILSFDIWWNKYENILEKKII